MRFKELEVLIIQFYSAGDKSPPNVSGNETAYFFPRFLQQQQQRPPARRTNKTGITLTVVNNE